MKTKSKIFKLVLLALMFVIAFSLRSLNIVVASDDDEKKEEPKHSHSYYWKKLDSNEHRRMCSTCAWKGDSQEKHTFQSLK